MRGQLALVAMALLVLLLIVRTDLGVTPLVDILKEARNVHSQEDRRGATQSSPQE